MLRLVHAMVVAGLTSAAAWLTPFSAHAILVESTLDLDTSNLTMEIKLDGVTEAVIPLVLVSGEPKFDVTQFGAQPPTQIAPLMGFNSGFALGTQVNTSHGLLTIDGLDFEIGGLLTPDSSNPGVLKLDGSSPFSFIMRGEEGIRLNGIPLYLGEVAAAGTGGPGDTGTWSEAPIVEGLYNLTIGVPVLAGNESQIGPDTPHLEVIVTGFLTYQGALPVPEPASFALAGFGALALLIVGLRRRYGS